jgi:hypothetical protein
MTAQDADGTRQPLGIVLAPLQIVEEGHELVPWSIPFEFAFQWFRFGERPLLHRQCGLQIDLGRFHRFMPEPQGNDGAVHTLLEEVEGHGVSKDMNGDAFAFQRRTDLGGSIDMTDQQVMYAVGAETRASGIGEKDLTITACWFAEPSFQYGDRGFGERYTTFLCAGKSYVPRITLHLQETSVPAYCIHVALRG